MIDSLLHGFAIALAPQALMASAIGVLIGTLVGVLPGLGPTATMALLLPVTYGMGPTASLIMLAGVYYGAQYGGSTSSILVNVPGEATSVVTAIDGYKMALKGRAGGALAVAAIGSFIAGTAGVVGLMLFSPMFAKIALAFGPPEYFAVAIFGFVLLFQLSGGSAMKAAAMGLAGIMIGTIGVDSVSGTPRFTFDYTPLLDGIDLIAVVMGLFGLPEVLRIIADPKAEAKPVPVRLRELYPTREEISRSVHPILRGTGLGFLVGLIPGPSGVIGTFLSYAVERRVSKRPEEFGEGAIEGVAGPEAANNATSSATLIPLLVLGLPFAAPTAVLLSGFMIHGIKPGPFLIERSPDVFWGLIASMYIGNVMLLILNLPMVGVFASLLRIRAKLLMPAVGALVLAGAYSLHNSMEDVWVTIIAGIVGLFMGKARLEPAPLILGMVLGPRLEDSFRRSLIMLDGSASAFLARPIVSGLFALSVIVIVTPMLLRLRRRARSG